ncbi:MAG TPA: hypothetical protein VGQ17_03790 [Gemmatimonadales bacterium]|jgi:hypothetical protein|nr:hypothetical protein [Gemmatimonadales bacterium]
MTGPSAEVVQPRPVAIISPLVDLLCVGGLSIVVIVPLLLSGREELGFITIGALIWTQALINYSHFMASYRIIYRGREMIRRHTWAAIWIPLIMLVFVAIALLLAPASQLLILAFFVVGSAYLAWHYTGQVWGMMASYSYLDGIRFDPTERWLIRASLRILLAWHVSWFLNLWLSHTEVATLPDLAAALYRLASYAAILAFPLGGIGLLHLRLRIGRYPPLRAAVAWLAIFVWYAAIARWGLPAFFLVQLAHALQYLEFPARVELNRVAGATVARTAGHMAGYAVALLAAAFLVILAVPGPAMSLVANFLGATPNNAAAALVLYFINIHHYFTDGVIWKISNPEVRKELFAHAAPPALPPVPVVRAGTKGGTGPGGSRPEPGRKARPR